MKGIVMKAAIVAMIILLLPAALFAGPTMGVYFTYVPGQMQYVTTHKFEEFYGYVYAHNSECYLNAAEFAMVLDTSVVYLGKTLPAGSLELGSLPAGLSVAYWPPMDGWNPGYNLLCTIKFMALEFCLCQGGSVQNNPIRIVAHPDTGLIQGSCWPENYLFEYTGLTSIICPNPYSVKETNWGAIKSLF
jgi:hypothetical protein